MTRAIVVAGVGSGLTAAAAAAAGADIVACYSTACFRIAGLPSGLSFLPYGDANALVRSVLPDVLVGAGAVPVVAGVGVHDPRVSIPRALDELDALGVHGVTNEPFIGMYDGDLRVQLEAAGLGYGRELELAAEASRRGKIMIGWAWSPDEAAQMAATGAQYVGCMLGITAGGAHASAPAAVSAAEANGRLRAMVEAAKAENSECLTLIHGGPLHERDVVQTALTESGADGYVSGSAAERVPVFDAMREAVLRYRTLERKKDR